MNQNWKLRAKLDFLCAATFGGALICGSIALAVFARLTLSDTPTAWQALMLGAGTGTIVLAAAVLVLRTLVQFVVVLPIERIADDALQMSLGSNKPIKTGATDEIGILADALNRMQHSVGKAIARIQEKAR